MSCNISLDHSCHDESLMIHYIEWHARYAQAERFVLAVVVVCGLSGNLMSFLVFTMTTLNKLPSSIYLSALSLVDSMFLLSLVPLELEHYGVDVYAPTGICHVMIYVTYSSSFLSIWFVTLFMIERYIVVCHPLKAVYLCSRKRAIILVCVLVVLSLSGFTYTVGSVSVEISSNQNRTACQLSEESFGPHSVFNYIDTALSFVLPFTAIFCFNIRVIVAIRSVRMDNFLIISGRRTHTILSNVQFRLTLTLIIVSFTFIILLFPSHVVRLTIIVLHSKISSSLQSMVIFKKVQCVAQLLSYLNYCVNFAIYSASSPLFRSGITQLLKRLKCRPSLLDVRDPLLVVSDVSERRTYMETPL